MIKPFSSKAFQSCYVIELVHLKYFLAQIESILIWAASMEAAGATVIEIFKCFFTFFHFKSFQEPSANPSSMIGKNVAYISLSKACLMVIKCLSLERDFNVLTLVLDDVPLVLCNKAVFVLYGNNIKVETWRI